MVPRARPSALERRSGTPLVTHLGRKRPPEPPITVVGSPVPLGRPRALERRTRE